jgi:hypothetical protein
MDKLSIIKYFAGALCGIVGILSILLPFATLEVSFLGFSVASETYNIIEILQLLEEMEYKDRIIRLSLGILIFGSIVSFGSVIRKQKVAIIGILMQIISIVVFLQTIILSESDRAFVGTEPEFGLYAMVSAPIIGIVFVLTIERGESPRF